MHYHVSIWAIPLYIYIKNISKNFLAVLEMFYLILTVYVIDCLTVFQMGKFCLVCTEMPGCQFKDLLFDRNIIR